MTSSGRKQLDDNRQIYYIDVEGVDADKVPAYLEQLKRYFHDHPPFKEDDSISMMQGT